MTIENDRTSTELVENEIVLKTITELLGLNFYIPEYQRGYRWTTHHVQQLLDDIWEYRNKGLANSFYCLQPVVVKKATWSDIDGELVEGYELIDGQQRLTTLHRIITYLMLEHLKTDSLKEDYGNERYHIYYKTRLISKAFLQSNEYDGSKPDLYYMSEAYKTIKAWFEDPERGFVRADKNKFLDTLLPSANNAEWSVKIIWYEVMESGNGASNQKSKDLFTRLNRGKIPLTSAELIKAKLVNSKSFGSRPQVEQVKRKTEIIQIWDEIEAGLNDTKFWAFITNRPANDYSNKIEMLFDILTGKKEKEPDPLYSFVHFFYGEDTEENIWKKWIEVEEVYRSFRYWFGDKNLYHKIGYLIATGTSTLELIRLKQDHTKSDLEAKLNDMITGTIPADWVDLLYDNRGDHEKISNVLLLHNLEIIRKNRSLNEFFPFEAFKKITKSLEHIHAQNTEDIDRNDRKQWIEWLNEHIKILGERTESDQNIKTVIDATKQALLNKFPYPVFKNLSQKIIACFDQDEGSGHEFMHRIDNMALLGLSENIVLSNSVFEVKRRKIIQMDKNGEFIPIATKRVFLKYYSGEHDPNYTLWTANDRENYLKDIREHLAPYIPEDLQPEELTIAESNED